MCNANPMTSLVLGAGGPQAGVQVVCPDTLEVSALLALPPGHSTYAVDVDVEQSIIAVGTRGGLIEVVCVTDAVAGPHRYRRFIQGASILSVCLIPDGRVVATDTAGRCLVWDPAADAEHPTAWKTEGCLVGGLVGLPGNRMAGLTREGTLLIWDAAHGRLIRCIEGPTPATKLALFRMRYWPAHGAIAYPAANGRLVIMEISDFKVRTYSAHPGGFHVVIVEGAQLHTIGTKDGLLKTWPTPAGPADEQCTAPKGVISGDVVPDGSRRLLLVNENGRAIIYDTQDGDLHVVRRLPGKQYRCVAGPSSQARHAAEERRRLTVARNLVAQAQQKLDANQLDGTEHLRARLADMGYESVSHGIAARRAAHAQDVIGELRSLHRLSLLVASKGSSGHQWLERYASLLEFVWQLNGTCRIRNYIGNDDNGYATGDWLQRAIDLMTGEDWVAQPNAPIPLLIEAATLMERPFIGCWAIQVSRPVDFPDRQLTAEKLADKYEQVRREQGASDLPAAEATMLSWLSPRRIRHVPAVVFNDSMRTTSSRIRLAIRIDNDGFERAIVPSVLFDAGRVQDDGWRAHNYSALQTYDRIASQQAIDHWPTELRQMLRSTLRRLSTKARSQWTG